MIHSNVKTNYNSFATKCLSVDDITRGVEFPEHIDTTILMKGLEYFFTDKKAK
jgi:hypothetical protein